MTRIISADLLIADVIIPLADNPALAALAEKYKLQPGGKQTLTSEQLAEFSAAVKNHSLTVMPGGSSANMLTTLAKLLGKDVEIRFLGVAGEGPYSSVIRTSLEEVGIKLLPERFPAGHTSPQSAVSFVFIFPDGQCTIATHPGNARDVLKPAMIAEHLVKNCDVLLAQGSLWYKMHAEFADRLYQLCLKHHRKLWLTLPTQAALSAEESTRIQKMLPTASLVLGNEAELVRLFDRPLKSALNDLQAVFRHKAKTGLPNEKSPVGFITFGKNGAAVVSAQGIDYIPSVHLDDHDIVNTLGAGDTAYAGFAAAMIREQSELQAARVAMMLAAQKLRLNGPRLPDPLATLKSASPDLAQLLSAK